MPCSPRGPHVPTNERACLTRSARSVGGANINHNSVSNSISVSYILFLAFVLAAPPQSSSFTVFTVVAAVFVLMRERT